jgi:cytochrome c-type biogenesis protein CcmH
VKRALAALAVVGMVVVGFVVASGSSGDESAGERAQRLSGRLRCPVCEGLSVADSASSTARAIRDDVKRRVEAGDADGEILQAYVDRYGEWILLSPRSDGVGSVVWMVPLAALLVGAALLGLAFFRWRSAPVPDDPEFVRRSLDDLEAEHDEGNLDEASYERLREDYTAAPAPGAPEPPGAPRRRGLVLALVVGFAVLAAVLLGGSLGERLPGETATGNAQSRGERAARVDRLAGAVERDPDDYEARMDYAAALLQEGRAADALEQYDAAAGQAPRDAEPRAYGGWIVFLAGLPDEARDRLDEAVAAERSFPDTYFFRGVVRLRLSEAKGAVSDLRRYLELDPRGVYEEQARVALREARGDGADSDDADRDTDTGSR